MVTFLRYSGVLEDPSFVSLSQTWQKAYCTFKSSAPTELLVLDPRAGLTRAVLPFLPRLDPSLDRLFFGMKASPSLSLGRKLPSAGSLLVGILVGLLVASVSQRHFQEGIVTYTCLPYSFYEKEM